MGRIGNVFSKWEKNIYLGLWLKNSYKNGKLHHWIIILIVMYDYLSTRWEPGGCNGQPVGGVEDRISI